jgi:hypothetical protein
MKAHYAAAGKAKRWQPERVSQNGEFRESCQVLQIGGALPGRLRIDILRFMSVTPKPSSGK